MSEITQTHTLIDGLPIAEYILGEGDPVLMLHGWGANGALVLPLAQRLAPLGYRLYVPDMPGFGTTPTPPVAWTVSDYARLVIAYLDAHQLDRVLLFGHSFGGRLGLVLGAEYPDRLHKMVLADSAGVRTPAPLAARARLTTYKLIRDGLTKVGLSGLSSRLREWYVDRYGSADYKNTDGVLRETFVKVIAEDLLPYAARVKPSTLLLWGEDDADTPLAHGRILEATIPDAGLVVFSGAGHYSYLDKLGETVQVMDYFYRH